MLFPFFQKKQFDSYDEHIKDQNTANTQISNMHAKPYLNTQVSNMPHASTHSSMQAKYMKRK